MKNYDETINSVFNRINEYEIQKKRKRKVVIRTTASLCCFCLAVLLGFGVWQSGMFDRQPPITLDDSTIIGEKDYLNPDELDNSQASNGNENKDPNTNPSGTGDFYKNYPDLTILSLSQWLDTDGIVWMDGSPIKGNASPGEHIDLGQVLINNELKGFFNGNQNTIYAVMVDFSSMPNDDFVFEGKKISEWNAEKDNLISLGKMSDAKLIAQKISQAKEAYYFSMLEKFKEQFALMGLGIYHEEHGSTIDNCIFYTFATQPQLEEFECTSTQAFVFSPAVRFK